MTEKKLKEAVAEKLELRGYDESLLTKEEMDALREECEAEARGDVFLDSVLDAPELLERWADKNNPFKK